MNRRHSQRCTRLCTRQIAHTAIVAWAVLLSACGGGTGTERDSGANKTYLNVEASDADGDTLSYQWRVTAGSIDNRNARETVWTMPDGPGLHFAYVTIGDGRGGYTEQQYAVASDALETTAPQRAQASHIAPAVSDFSGSAARLRFASESDTRFAAAAGGASARRAVYLPDMAVQVVDGGGATVFSGSTDLSGEVSLPKLRSGQTYSVRCATSQDAPLRPCGTLNAGLEAEVRNFTPALAPALTPERNLRLHGHIALADGGVCGTQDEFFALQSAATVQLLQADGTALTTPQRVNRFGDYAIDAAVPVRSNLRVQVKCETYSQALDVPASSAAAGYVSTQPVELSYPIPNSRPRIVKMVANGPEGNVRGRMVVPETGVQSNGLPGMRHFLSFKGLDTRASGCRYYRALGAVKDCDAQGGMVEPISFDDWKRQHRFAPYGAGNAEVAANYINQMDLNLVRRMVATQSAPQTIAFYVCNHPGPEGKTQLEVDRVLETGLAGERQIACVAMEWSATPGVNANQPFTKFLTFGSDGALLPSVNLDGRGEKYLPGACVACHGGSQYNGRFPDQGNPSPYLGSKFLPFDTGNYLFGSHAALTEGAQGASFRGLNRLVRATEASDITAVARLIDGWYASNTDTLDKAYVPPAWRTADASTGTAGAARFYREVVGASCRTCHVSLGSNFDWDATVLTPLRASPHVCGGTADIAINATMPNALTSRDRIAERVQADPSLAALMRSFLGCDAPLPDPVYPRR